MTPYFSSTISERDKWLVITSSYNQGKNHYIKALQALNARKEDQNWTNILAQVLSQSPRPWVENANNYGPKILSSLNISQLSSGRSLASFSIPSISFNHIGIGIILLLSGIIVYRTVSSTSTARA